VFLFRAVDVAHLAHLQVLLLAFPALFRGGHLLQDARTAGRVAGGSGAPWSGNASAPGMAAQGWTPSGYDLPPQCAKHAVLYANVFTDLAPWFQRGITRADLDACAPVVDPVE
jgi:hypothetical protein